MRNDLSKGYGRSTGKRGYHDRNDMHDMRQCTNNCKDAIRSSASGLLGIWFDVRSRHPATSLSLACDRMILCEILVPPLLFRISLEVLALAVSSSTLSI